MLINNIFLNAQEDPVKTPINTNIKIPAHGPANSGGNTATWKKRKKIMTTLFAAAEMNISGITKHKNLDF